MTIEDQTEGYTLVRGIAKAVKRHLTVTAGGFEQLPMICKLASFIL